MQEQNLLIQTELQIYQEINRSFPRSIFSAPDKKHSQLRACPSLYLSVTFLLLKMDYSEWLNGKQDALKTGYEAKRSAILLTYLFIVSYKSTTAYTLSLFALFLVCITV